MFVPFGEYYPAFMPSAAFFAVGASNPSDDLLRYPEETQLEILHRGADSDWELHRELEELNEKE